MPLIAFDFGNARGKFYVPAARYYDDFRHAIAPLDDATWRRVVGRGAPPAGVIRVNGQGYAVGDVARRYVIAERPTGASRYRPDYYGIGLAYAMAEGFRTSQANVSLMASHAPQDIEYARFLKDSAMGMWEVESHLGRLQFNVRKVATFDEPLGGYSDFTLTNKGTERNNNPLRNITTLVIDVGGHTVDVAAIDSGGEIDVMSLKSTRTGILNLTSNFESALRANNPLNFQDAGDLDIKRVETAILTGLYKFGKVTIDCRVEAQAGINALVNDIRDIIQAAGGVQNYDVMLLTGGGAVLVADALQSVVNRAEFIYAESDTDLMKYANVFGGAKIHAMLRNVGAW